MYIHHYILQTRSELEYNVRMYQEIASPHFDVIQLAIMYCGLKKKKKGKNIFGGLKIGQTLEYTDYCHPYTHHQAKPNKNLRQ